MKTPAIGKRQNYTKEERQGVLDASKRAFGLQEKFKGSTNLNQIP